MYFRFLLLLSLIIFQSSFALAKNVVLSGIERKDFTTDLLELSFSYLPNKKYTLAFHNADVPKERVLRIIQQNEGIDIIAAGATVERETKLQPIRFPIFKGLFGWRIPLLKEDKQGMFSDLLSQKAFKNLVAGQLFSWSDTRILQANGISVETGSDFEGLFEMLKRDRFDYFPRSVLEVEEEYEKHKHLSLVMDKNILIHYPAAYYFFVSKNNSELANDITFGLEQALKDGEYEKLFNQYHHELLSRLNLSERNVYSLKNPFLTSETPLERNELWFNLQPNQ